MKRIGIDVGSTTLKTVILDDECNIVFTDYQRHYSEIIDKCIEILSKLKRYTNDDEVLISISGSAGMGIAESSSIPFIQEVYATKLASERYSKETDVIIELGGEDAKILYLRDGLEVRMNGTCAGGTGAFIDQMATILGISVNELASLSENATEIYTIASRCGVFAKTDIQPLINEGASKENLAASILMSVVNQTIGGLAQGREIRGNILYLGGPLTFIPKLRKLFDESLKAKGTCPSNSLFYVALGAALSKMCKAMTIDEAIERISSYKGKEIKAASSPLFENEESYEEFKHRHQRNCVDRRNLESYKGFSYLGIDSGSTTIKCALISEDNKILLDKYESNKGNPIDSVKAFLRELYEKYPSIHIRAAASTGYGEELMKNAFNLDFSLVETLAHFKAAQFFRNDVDFIIDIGGQDIKCFKIKDGSIDDIFLNEACSSGCGSFLQAFANALGKMPEEFASLAINSKNPVDLGSRCTVFMNSSIKQAQKDGATISDISAGLAISVVKNALYKVIRATTKEELGYNIVVQGGTFLNDAVLRAFEKELEIEATRPNISGLMGAYGAALYAKELAQKKGITKSSIVDKSSLSEMRYETKAARCKICQNHCLLSISNFGDGRKLISGNKCNNPTGKKTAQNSSERNIYKYKQELLSSYIFRTVNAKRGTLGLPLSLGIYELLPFYSTLFRTLGFDVIVSPLINKNLYAKGQSFIPSDTVCFPSQLMHGSIEYLKDMKAETIFIPCSSYNIDEKRANNHFNCPIVAYYGEVIKDSHRFEECNLILGFLSLENAHHLSKRVSKLFNIPLNETKKAVKAAFEEQDSYREKIRSKGVEIIKNARAENRKIILLSGRPYHVDPEVNHSIDKLIVELGASVISEDSVLCAKEKYDARVLNQWTYHSRLYDAANFVCQNKDMELVQLVSFGCGLDAITTDEVRDILHRYGKIYTQLKIDEITNIGAVKIRLKSLFAALEA